MRFKSIYLERIPIPASDNPRPIEDLVTAILASKKKSPNADVSHLEREIDQIVYRLYGLTAGEIGVLEGNVT